MQPAASATPPLRLSLADEPATLALAAWIAARLQAGWRLYLSGELGAGKTRFTRGLLASLGHHGRVRSPTFTLAEPYNLPRFELYHFDFYRFSAEHEWQDAGFDEILSDAAITSVVEWPEMAGGSLPPADLRMRLAFDASPGEARRDAPDAAVPADDDLPDDPRRLVELGADTDRGRACLSALVADVRAGRLAGVSCEPAQA